MLESGVVAAVLPPEAGAPGRALLPERLIVGYRAFLGARFAQEQDRFRHLAAVGQSPRIMLIGCCDSRVPPEVIFDAEPGELFVVRNIANLVPAYEPSGGTHGVSAALEFAVTRLNVDHIVVMGHAGCGGVSAFVNGEIAPGDFIGGWIRPIERAAARVARGETSVEDYIERLALASVRQALVNLRSFPWIDERERQCKLRLHGAYFGVASGALLALDERSGRFEPIAKEAHRAALAAGRR
jgi:carbonic anhydrase